MRPSHPCGGGGGIVGAWRQQHRGEGRSEDVAWSPIAQDRSGASETQQGSSMLGKAHLLQKQMVASRSAGMPLQDVA